VGLDERNRNVRGHKTALQEIRQLSVGSPPPVPEAAVDLAMQAEVAAFFAHYQQEHPEATALAWSAGVYNPLATVDLLAVGARFLEPEEEDWLALARMVGWLCVEDELDAIYFAAGSLSKVLMCFCGHVSRPLSRHI
jgi:NAD(P)-dependent dehydrogenase (short-subunit alcohol dehydrogenase family)